MLSFYSSAQMVSKKLLRMYAQVHAFNDVCIYIVIYSFSVSCRCKYM